MREKTVRGTKPTLFQRKVLANNGFNADTFMFIKEITRPEDGEYNSKNRKSLNKSSKKVRYLEFVNTITGQRYEIKV